VGARRWRQSERRLATTVNNPTGGKVAGDAAIWAECLALCREIHAENLASPVGVSDPYSTPSTARRQR